MLGGGGYYVVMGFADGGLEAQVAHGRRMGLVVGGV